MSAIKEIHGCPLLERIGEGGIADVFRSTWQGREVALKVLREPDRVSVARRFAREGRLLQRLHHPGLVQCFEVLGGDTPALVLELLRGTALDERLARQPLDGNEAMGVGSAILRVLQHLHERGVVHRDVKSSNIFCTGDNRTVLMDLGLAADVADPLSTTLGDVLGTYAYMAPEQIAGSETDHRCDLYSLGVTLYEAVCGTRPYNARSAAAWLVAHRSGEATPLGEVASGVPVRFAALVDRLMARDPAVRPSSAAVALALLTGAVGSRFPLHSPVMGGRGSAIGAVSAVIDGGGWLQLIGPMGCGFSAMARRARLLAAESGVEVIGFRGRRRMGADDVRNVLSQELVRFGLPQAESEAALLVLLEDLAREGVVLLLAEEVDSLAPEALEVLTRASKVQGLAAVHFGTELPEEEGARRLELRPLSTEEIRRVVEGMLSTQAVPAGFDQALAEASGGLPAFVVALVREQVEAGCLRREGLADTGQPAWSWDASGGVVPGDGTTRMLGRALRSLSSGSRAALELLAVADDNVPVELAIVALGGTGDGLEFGQLVGRGMVRSWTEGGEDWMAVSRASIERVVLEGIAPARKRELHGNLADAAQARGEGEWERRFLLFHRSLASVGGEGAVALVELGELLARAGRPIRALRVLDVVPEGGETALPELLPRRAMARVEALVTLGRLGEALTALAAGARLASDVSTPTEARLVDSLELEILLDMGSPPSAALIERVSARMGDGAVGALHAMGRLAAMRGQLPAAASLFSAAGASAGSRIDRLAVRSQLGHAEMMLLSGKAIESERALAGLVRALRGRDRGSLLAAAFVALARVQRTLGQLGRAADTIVLAATGRSVGTPAAALGTDVIAAWVAVGTGDLVLASRSLARVGAVVGAVRYPVRALYFEVLAELRRAQNDGPAALAAHLAGAEAARTADDALGLAFHEAMAALRTANAQLTANAVARLTEVGAPRHLAQLYLLGGVIGRDPEILASAETAARECEDPILLLNVLFEGRGAGRRAEARSLAIGVLDGINGPARDCFRDQPHVRWALAEASRSEGGPRDTRV